MRHNHQPWPTKRQYSEKLFWCLSFVPEHLAHLGVRDETRFHDPFTSETPIIYLPYRFPLSLILASPVPVGPGQLLKS